MQPNSPTLLFTDFFKVDKTVLHQYGAFDISLIADLPLFIDPFLLFHSKKPEYQKLHQEIIEYLRFLKNRSQNQTLDDGLIAAWFAFKEVKQNWLGFSAKGNRGSALGQKFAHALHRNFYRVFPNYGTENITQGSHLEKLCLIEDGVGKDNISDFTTNLIKNFLLTYTSDFAKNNIDPSLCRIFRIKRTVFNYETETWEERNFYLPNFKGDFVILTPEDLLTRDDIWINRDDMVTDFAQLPSSIGDAQLRSQINNYFLKILPEHPKNKDRAEAVRKTILEYPVLIDYYIKHKEVNGEQAQVRSNKKVIYSENLYTEQFRDLSILLNEKTDFYNKVPDTYVACKERALFLKQVIENNDGYRKVYDKFGQPVQKEEDIQLLYRLTWFATIFDVNTEVNNGRGPADMKVSMGSADSTIVEFKLASNPQLKKNLQNQVEIYKKANNTRKSLKIIFFFTLNELRKVQKILKELNLETDESIVLIDARKDNKTSASKAELTPLTAEIINPNLTSK